VHRLYKRGDVWHCSGYDRNRKRWRESTGQSDKHAAEEVAREIERRRSGLRGLALEPLSLEKAFLDVIAARRREGKSAYTIQQYRYAGGHICRILGAGLDVHELGLSHLEHYIDKRLEDEGRAVGSTTMRATVAMELTKLKAALAYAKRRGLYHGNIEALWPGEALRGAHVPRERWLTVDEYRRLLGALDCEEQRHEHIIAYVNTGCRRQELGRIEARDVDLAAGMLHIRGTKTKGADRFIPISAELRPVLVRRVAERPTGPLFPRWFESKPLHHACKRAGIPIVCCNDLRRTFASWLAQRGVPMLVTARLMGHSSTKMVERVYARLGGDDLRAAIAKLPTGGE
jgi:integrase